MALRREEAVGEQMSPTSTGHRTWLASAWLLLATLMLACPVPAHATTVAGSIPVGTNPQRAVITPNGAEVYVSNLGSNNVSVIDTATNTLTHTIPVGLEPDALAVSPDGSKVYVGEHLENVSVIDTATKAVSTIATGLPVRDLAITPDSQNVYLAMEFSGLRKIVTSNNTVSTVSGAVCPEAVVVTPAGARAYVNYQCAPPPGTGGHDPIYLFDVATDTQIAAIAFLPNGVRMPNVGSVMAVSPNGAQVWANGADACSSPFYDHAGCPIVPAGVVNVDPDFRQHRDQDPRVSRRGKPHHNFSCRQYGRTGLTYRMIVDCSPKEQSHRRKEAGHEPGYYTRGPR